jgi:hypothetical protein
MRFPDGSTKAPYVTSPFGKRQGGAFSFHYGADMIGFATIKAVASGKVTFAGWMNNAAGNTVVIDHGNGVTSLYMHNAQHYVRKGDNVKEGQDIAFMGRSGNATGACCHLEIRVHGTSVEPVSYINARLSAPAGEAKTPEPVEVPEEMESNMYIVKEQNGTYWLIYSDGRRVGIRNELELNLIRRVKLSKTGRDFNKPDEDVLNRREMDILDYYFPEVK